MSDGEQRYDVAYFENGATIQPHHCRSWEPDETGELVGCYGTNTGHGYPLADACAYVAEWHRGQAREHEKQAALWDAMQHPDALYYTAPEPPAP